MAIVTFADSHYTRADDVVQLGVSWLDVNVAHWRSLVSAANLRMYSPSSCLLGQVYRSLTGCDDYSWFDILRWVNDCYAPLGQLDDRVSVDDALDKWARRLGFNIGDLNTYADLDLAWRRALSQPAAVQVQVAASWELTPAEVELVERHRRKLKLERKKTKLEKRLVLLEDELSELG